MTLPRKHLHTLPTGTALPDATANEEGFPFLLETTSGSLTTRTLYQNQGGSWSGLAVCPPPATEVTANYTLSAGDVGKVIDVAGTSGVAVTVPASTTTPLPIGATVTVVNTTGNAVTFVADEGVAVHALNGSTALAGQWAQGVLRQRDTDVWVLTGDLD